MTSSAAKPGGAYPRGPAASGRARIWAAVVLLSLGAAAIVYGAAVHVIPVLVERAGPTEPPVPVVESPSAVAAAETVTLTEPEPRLVREVTVGGVTRVASGEIKRTYSGDAPPQCPT